MIKPIKIYADNIEQTALDQFNSAMAQDFAVQGALMPDAHTGYSLPIGAVVATRDIVVPAWVGYDIGCGMCAQKISTHVDAVKDYRRNIFKDIYASIPVGFNSNKAIEPWMTELNIDDLTAAGKAIALKKKWLNAMCSLGGGNHFIEIGEDENHDVWIVVHSGSRGVGHGIAKHYMTVASAIDRTEVGAEFDTTHKNLLKHNPAQYNEYREAFIDKARLKAKPKEGHYGFDVNSKEGADYINDMNWCLYFALDNRRTMIERVMDSIRSMTGACNAESDMINRNHNHAEKKDGLWIHRKGATHAEEGMMGVIPGNMRDGSFIVCGKGNPESLCSSSHGAGRVMSRKQARYQLTLDGFKGTMQNITAKVNADTLDEAPGAYKNIFTVMEQQKDLVDTLHYVKPIINVKG